MPKIFISEKEMLSKPSKLSSTLYMGKTQNSLENRSKGQYDYITESLKPCLMKLSERYDFYKSISRRKFGLSGTKTVMFIYNETEKYFKSWYNNIKALGERELSIKIHNYFSARKIYTKAEKLYARKMLTMALTQNVSKLHPLFLPRTICFRWLRKSEVWISGGLCRKRTRSIASSTDKNNPVRLSTDF